MFKVLLLSLVAVAYGVNIDLSRRTLFNRFGIIPETVSAVEEAVAVAPVVEAVGPAVSYAAPVGGWQLSSLQKVAAPVLNPIRAYRTQEVLPIQHLDVRSGPQLVQVRAENQDPVLVHFQTQSAPVKVETSHLRSPPQEVTFTQTEDEPHRVVHQVIRPVIQEIREIIQPYRKITQEIRPVQEEVHTSVATGDARAAPAPAVVDAPAAVDVPAVVAAPVPAVVSGPAIIEAPAKAVVAAPAPIQYSYAQPAQAVQSAVARFGLIAPPAPLYTGSYIYQMIENLKAQNQKALISEPVSIIEAPAVLEAPKAAEAVAVEPIASEAVVPAKKTLNTQGAARLTRKYVEYPRK